MNNERNLIFTETLEGAKTYDLMPHYSTSAIHYIYTNLFKNQSQIIADIGSGTGRLASQIMPNNYVYGVEPDHNMRTIEFEKLGFFHNFKSVEGTATKTNLPQNSVNYVTVGQALHRFDIDLFRLEASRILTNSNNIIIFWNRIDYSLPIYSDLISTIKKCYKTYKSRFENNNEIEGSILEQSQNDDLVSDLFFGKFKKLTFDNPNKLTEKDFQKLCLSLWIFPLSNGYENEKIIRSNQFDLKMFQKNIFSIFLKYQKNKYITLPLTTDIYFK